jgi:polyribonucleotide nucleotidyltransferase
LLAQLEAGKVPKVDKDVVSDEEPEETPALEFEVPRHKVKLIIGAGGERIKQIQRKTRTRIQVRTSTHRSLAIVLVLSGS